MVVGNSDLQNVEHIFKVVFFVQPNLENKQPISLINQYFTKKNRKLSKVKYKYKSPIISRSNGFLLSAAIVADFKQRMTLMKANI